MTAVIASIICGGPANADCLVIARLDGILAVEQRIARATFEPDLKSIALFLQREDARINSSNLAESVGPDNIAAFETFVTHTKTFLRLATDDGAAAHAFLQSTDVAENMRDITARMADLRCQPRADAQSLPATDATGTSLSGVPLNFTLSAAKVAAVFASIIGSGIALFGVMRLRSQRQRRAKRHRIHYPTSYHNAGVTLDGVLLDISGAGVKLRHDPVHPMEIGSPITVQIMDQWISGTVQWSNPNYTGVLFKSAMGARQAQQLVRAPKKPLQQKTAPQRDAV